MLLLLDLNSNSALKKSGIIYDDDYWKQPKKHNTEENPSCKQGVSLQSATGIYYNEASEHLHF